MTAIRRGSQRPEEVEEADHVARLGHSRDHQAGAEQAARSERRDHAGAHGAPRATRMRLTTATVAAPVAMNVAVATSDASDPREMPHRPCPDVQPPPRRVPNPTSRPAASNTGVAVALAAAGAREQRRDQPGGDQAGEKRQPLIAGLRLRSAPPRIPLTPATRPVASQYNVGRKADQRAAQQSRQHGREPYRIGVPYARRSLRGAVIVARGVIRSRFMAPKQQAMAPRRVPVPPGDEVGAADMARRVAENLRQHRKRLELSLESARAARPASVGRRCPRSRHERRIRPSGCCGRSRRAWAFRSPTSSASRGLRCPSSVEKMPSY